MGVLPTTIPDLFVAFVWQLEEKGAKCERQYLLWAVDYTVFTWINLVCIWITWLNLRRRVLWFLSALSFSGSVPLQVKPCTRVLSSFVCQNISDRPRVPTRPGKPGKMRVHLENLEISWNFEKINKYYGKMIWNLEKLGGY